MYYIVLFAKRLGIPNISQYSYTRVQLLEYVAQSAYFYVPNVVQNVFGCESFISIHINNYTINIQGIEIRHHMQSRDCTLNVNYDFPLSINNSIEIEYL